MTSSTRKLVLAAVLATALPAASLARDCDHDGDRDRDDRTAYPYPAPPPAYPPPPAAYPAPRPAPIARDGGWRWREREALRAELRALEQERADFHARFGWHPRKVARFERWYAIRHAELEQRWHALDGYAWR